MIVKESVLNTFIVVADAMTASGTTIIGLAAAAAPELNSGCPGSGLLAN